MAVPSTAEQFLDLACSLGLLDGQDLGAYRRRDAGPAADVPRAVAEALVRDRLLTRFQAENLLYGRWKDLVLAGKYWVLGPLGSGGMGRVFLCEHQVMRRLVAVKVLPAGPGDAAALERFRREARAVAQLNHPNVVSGYDIDRDGDLHFLVMEYVDGSDLHAVVKRRGPLEVARACNYALQACRGLQHAHEAGLVHRDVKPANLLLDRAGTVKVLDLGLARFSGDEADDLSRRGVGPLGTTDYMAPEQALDSHGVDIRADVYSLGATLYFLLAGHGPFPGGPALPKMMRHRFERPRPIREVRPEVPEGLAAALDRMLAKDPAERHQTPAEVAEALAAWGQSPVPPPPEEMPRLASPARGEGGGDAAPGLPASLYEPAATLAPPPPLGGEAAASLGSELPTVNQLEGSGDTSSAETGLGPQSAAEPTRRPPARPQPTGRAPHPEPPPAPPAAGADAGRRGRWAVLVAALLLVGVGALVFYKMAGGPPPRPAGPTRLRLLVPAYFYPAGEGLEHWGRLIDSPAAADTVAVVNPDSGPGKEADPNYAKAMERARRKGVTTIGYVSTKYAKRPLDEVKGEVDRWVRFYPGVQGVFFDEQASEAEHVDHYAALYQYVRKARGLSLVVTNPGAACAEGYVTRPASDVVCLVESHRDFGTYHRPAWTAGHAPDRFAALLYNVGSRERMRASVLDMRVHGVGYCFVTSGRGPNPWDRLPGYWGEEVEAVREVNGR